MRVYIVGGTGFVGTNLARRFRGRGDEVTLMGRAPGRPPGLDETVRIVQGDGRVPGPWQEEIARHDLVINLAGASIFTRWTVAAKREIIESRVLTTRNIVAAIPAGGGVTFCSTSAVGYYGFRGDEELDEAGTPGDDFLARVCVAWEAEALQAEARGVRVIITRFGIVFGPGGGVLGEIIPLFRRFLGGRLGSGRQWFSWIHIEDLFGAYLHLAGSPTARGAYNCTAPNPVRNLELTAALGRVLDRPTLVPAPAFAVRLALGEFGTVLLEGQRVLPRRLLAEGYPFAYPRIEPALAALAPSFP